MLYYNCLFLSYCESQFKKNFHYLLSDYNHFWIFVTFLCGEFEKLILIKNFKKLENSKNPKPWHTGGGSGIYT